MQKKIKLHRANIDYLIGKFFPSGSGFDCDYETVELQDSFHIKSSYHCVDEHGRYDGCQDFTIKIKKEWLDSEFTLHFNNGSYKSIKYGLRDYMEDTLYHHFDELFTNHGVEEVTRNYYQREFDRIIGKDKINSGEIKIAIHNSISGATKWMNLNEECIDALNEYLRDVTLKILKAGK